MTDTKKKKRRAYLDSFHKNSKGTYEYKGDMYIFQGIGPRSGQGSKEAVSETNLKKVLLPLWGLCIVLLVSMIAAGCMTAPGIDNCFYVILPYAAEIIAGISVCWALCRLTFGGNPLKAYIYESSVKALPVRTMIAAVAAGLCMAGEIIFVCRQGIGEKIGSFCIFLILNVLTIIVSMISRRKILSMQWKKHD